MFEEEFDSTLESTLLSGLDLGVAQVAADGKSMRASLPVVPLVPRLKLPTAQYLVSQNLSVMREQRVDRAAVNQKRNIGLGVFLVVLNHCKYGHRIGSR